MNKLKYIVLLAAIAYAAADLQAQNLIPFSKGTEWGYKTSDGEVVVDAVYSAVSLPASSYGLVCKNNKWGVIESSGKEVIPPTYDYIDLCNEGIVAVYIGCVDAETHIMSKGYWGYVDLANPGKVLLSEAGMLGPFIDSVAWVNTSCSKLPRQRRTMPILDKKGKVIGENIIFGVSRSFEMNDIVLAEQDGSYPDMTGVWVLYNRDMQRLTDKSYEMVGAFHDELAWVKRNGKYGYVNRYGEEVIPAEYISVQGAPAAKTVSLRLNPENGAVRWVMNANGEIAWLNEKGETVIDFMKTDGRINIESVADERMWDF